MDSGKLNLYAGTEFTGSDEMAQFAAMKLEIGKQWTDAQLRGYIKYRQSFNKTHIKTEMFGIGLTLLLMFAAPPAGYGRLGGAIWESGRDECKPGVCVWMGVNLLGSVLGLWVGISHWRLVGRCVDGYDWGVNFCEKFNNWFSGKRVELRVRDPQNAISRMYHTPESSTLIDTCTTVLVVIMPTGVFEFLRALHSTVLEYTEDEDETAIFPLITSFAIAFVPIVQGLWRLRAYTLLSDMPKMDTSPSADIPGGTEATRADQRSAQLQRLGAYGDDSVEDEDVV